MSEQVAVNEQASSMWAYWDRERIEDTVREAGSAEFYLGTLATDTGNFSHSINAIRSRIDGLLQMFDIDPNGWDEAALKLTHNSRAWEPDSFKEDIVHIKRGRDLGTFIADSGAADMDIEGSEDGVGGATLDYMLNPNLMAIFRASGDFWTTRVFIDPRTSQITDETNDAELLQELEKEAPVGIDSRADYQLELSVRILCPEEADQITS